MWKCCVHVLVTVNTAVALSPFVELFRPCDISICNKVYHSVLSIYCVCSTTVLALIEEPGLLGEMGEGLVI